MKLLNERKYNKVVNFFVPPSYYNSLSKKAGLAGAAIGAIGGTGILEDDTTKAETNGLGRIGKVLGGAVIGGGLGYGGAKLAKNVITSKNPQANSTNSPNTVKPDRVNKNTVEVDEVSAVDGMVNTKTFNMNEPRDKMEYATRKYKEFRNTLTGQPTPAQQQELSRLKQEMVAAKSMKANLSRQRKTVVNFYSKYYLAKFYV